MNGMRINKEELFKAACCNLGESFTTNPSVDVSYDDAATGAKQIKLLGLSGIYVQMLTENLPNFRGAAIPYALGYVPGPWMKSIQVSKGASSVRNGYESITGQIDVEYLKSQDEQGATVNLYGNSDGRVEANADANLHFNPQLSSEILAHYEDNIVRNTDMNHDGFLDKPNVRQLNLQNRWRWANKRYVFHGGLGMIDEKRESGQINDNDNHNENSHPDGFSLPLGGAGGGLFTTYASPSIASRFTPYASRFKIELTTHRYEAYMKHAFLLNEEHATNIAFMSSASMHKQEGTYGHKYYDVDNKNLYAQLLFETNLSPLHNLSLGLSLNHDYLGQHYKSETLTYPKDKEKETTPGIYAQYTLNLHDQLVIMAGVRADHSSQHGTFVTPRFHLRYDPTSLLTLRLSAGKGYRTVHALAENNYLLASGRQLIIHPLSQESAWNYGVSTSLRIPLFSNTLKLNAEYYHTHFHNQAVIDYDTHHQEIHIADLDGKSYSHTFQVDATYPILPGLELTAAYRLNDVKTTYGGQLMSKPLTSKYKALTSLSYKTPLGIWQFDTTLLINGGGRMPTPYTKADGTPSWDKHFPAFCQLQAQITRWFRHFSIYLGGENLTGYRQPNPIISAQQPWCTEFEPTLVWGPVSGVMAYLGIRINIGRTL
jgi:outer membrane receptor protein involved in Fe transport